MFDVLMSSQVRPRLHPGRGICVAALHGVLVAGAVRVARPAPAPETGPTVDTTVFIVAPPPSSEQPLVHASEGGFVLGPAVDLPLPPIDVPTFIPPLTRGPALDPDLIRRSLTAGPPAS